MTQKKRREEADQIWRGRVTMRREVSGSRRDRIVAIKWDAEVEAGSTGLKREDSMRRSDSRTLRTSLR